MPWLACGDRVVASLEVARTPQQRRRGLLGRSDITGALLIEPCRSVHTIGMRFPIDVAYLDRHRQVLHIVTMPPNRIGKPRPSARSVLEARAAAFDHWRITPGDIVDIRLDS